MRLRFPLVLAAISVLACSGVPDVRGTLGATCASPTVAPSVTLAELTGPAATVEPDVLLELTPEAYRVNGREADTLQLLSDERARAAELAELTGANRSGIQLVAPAEQTTGARLVEVLDDLRGIGVTQVRFLLRSPEERPPPAFVDPAYAAELGARVSGVDPAQRQTVVAAEIESLLVACPSGQAAFGAVAMASPEMRCELMVVGLEEALPSCPLTSGDKVVTALQLIFAPPPYQLVTLDLELAAEAEPFPIAAGAEWAEIAALWQPRSGSPARWVLAGDGVATADDTAGAAPSPAPSGTTGTKPTAGAKTGPVTAAGPLDKALISRVLARNRNQIRACYEQALSRKPDASGRLLLALEIGAGGSVASATMTEDAIGDPQLTSCLLTSARKLTFPASSGTTSLTLPLVFAPS